MKLPKSIQTALAARPQGGPTNLFEMPFADIIKIGYKPLKPGVDAYQDGDLICATTKEQDLWIVVDNAAHLRKGLRAKEIGANVLVYRK